MSLSTPGNYTVYYEGPRASEEGALVPDFGISLVAVGGGESVTLSDYGGTLSYGTGRYAGRAVATFHLEDPGRYSLRTSSRGEPGQLAVGPGVGKKLVKTVLGALVLGFVGVGGGAAVLIVTAVRRAASRRHS